jgi:hypothetical protein
MKGRLMLILFVLGLLFFIQAAIISLVQFPRAEYPPNLEPMHLYIRELQLSEGVKSLIGSLFGCLACWILGLYLRTRRLEREVNAYRESPSTSDMGGESIA